MRDGSAGPWLACSARSPLLPVCAPAPCPPAQRLAPAFCAAPARVPAGGGNQRDKGGAVAIRQSYLRVVGFQEDVLNGDTARRPTFT